MDKRIKACIWVNGELRFADKAKEATVESDLIIAADGGTRHLSMLGIKPHIIIGDMDSTDRSLWENDVSIERIVVPEEKNKTDTELAVDLAFERGCFQVTLLAAMGGRIDHMLGNVLLVAKYPGQVAILEGESTLVAIDNTHKLKYKGNIGDTLSLIPFGKSVEKVQTVGLKYQLDNEDILIGTKGISNQLSSKECYTCISAGLLLTCILRNNQL